MVWLSAKWKLWVMLAPALIIFSVFVIYPVFYSLWYSFTDFSGFGETTFVGFTNYEQLGDDQFFWTALGNTLLILVVSIVVLIPASFALAMLLRVKVKGAGLLRSLVFAPAIIAPILVGLIWVFILDPKLGLINRALAAVGLPGDIQWIGGNTLTPYAIALVFIWSSIGFAMTIFYAGLQMLPGDVLEASSLDGASGIQQLRWITIPMMRGSFAIVAVLLITNVFKIFELVYVLTSGGPVHRSEVLVSYMYFVTFTNLQYGPGMAIAVIITVLGAIFSVGYLVLARDKKGTTA